MLPQSKFVILVLTFDATIDQSVVGPSIMFPVDGAAEMEWVTAGVADRYQSVF